MNQVADYTLCAEYASKYKFVADKLSEDTLEMLYYLEPVVVNCAFSCELYLKAIILKRNEGNKREKVHDLKVLFNELPAEVRTSICNGKVDEEKLDEFLGEYGNAFLDWRYAFEKGVEMNMTMLFNFANLLEDYYERTKND